ncbi:hypothetical protein NDU88_004469 [Pleurodeles waltl]|uniref:Uncharacterized protein n=1 Tax=Pleurodeles waltl TaxID=8319 RepID=A0AAV7RHG2_PLEWA|nr:hypothetical protein NDU88_004469 [Pleurodeles waltl]
MSAMECDDFLKDLDLLILGDEDQNGLEDDLTPVKLVAAIRSLYSGKSVGPNGLAIEMYKGMVEKVAEHMLAMFQAALREGGLHQTRGQLRSWSFQNKANL